jgi:starch synthase
VAVRVLFVAPELAPWMKSGGLGEVAAALPAALRAIGVDARVLVPAYPPLRDAFNGARTATDLLDFGAGFAPVRLLAAQTDAGVPLFLIECPGCYNRRGTAYLHPGGHDWPDNHLRFGLLSRTAALLGGADSPLDWRPDVVHCHDWPAGLAPAYLSYASGPRSATLMTIHNVAFQGIFPAATLHALGLPPESFAIEGVEYYGKLSFLKAGIHYADRISTVSPTYAREIQTDELGCGLGGLLRHRAGHFSGILNGIDTSIWDPAGDPFIARRYDAAHLARKHANKVELQRRVELEPDGNLPLLGVVSRLTHQKGLDLVAAISDRLIGFPAQLVVLGAGEAGLEAEFRALAARFPRRFAAVIGYDEPLAHLIEAGADIFLMPSRFEPCGLNQMYSMRYGTPPVAHATGGLADTVVDCTPHALKNGAATGFVFGELNAGALYQAIARALAAWHDKPSWRRLQRNGMKQDFSWRKAAHEYRALYQALVPPARPT